MNVTVSEQLDQVSIPWVYVLQLPGFFWALEMSPPKKGDDSRSWNHCYFSEGFWKGNYSSGPLDGFSLLLSGPHLPRPRCRAHRIGAWVQADKMRLLVPQSSPPLPKETQRRQGRQTSAPKVNMASSFENMKKSLTKPIPKTFHVQLEYALFLLMFPKI